MSVTRLVGAQRAGRVWPARTGAALRIPTMRYLDGLRTEAPAWIVLALGAALSVYISMLTSTSIEQDVEVRNERRLGVVKNALEQRIAVHFEMLRGVNALFHKDPHILPSRAEFSRYVKKAGLLDRYPGFRAVTLTRYVPAAERNAFEERLRRDPAVAAGDARIAVWPLTGQPDHYALVPEAAADRQAQDRQVVHRRPAGRSKRRGDLERRHRIGEGPRPAGDCRGSRNRRAADLPRPTGLRRDAGLFLQPAGQRGADPRTPREGSAPAGQELWREGVRARASSAAM